MLLYYFFRRLRPNWIKLFSKNLFQKQTPSHSVIGTAGSLFEKCISQSTKYSPKKTDNLCMTAKRKKFYAFCRLTGRIGAAIQVWELGIEDNDYSARFSEDRIPMLQRFCENNPQFHIMSRLGKNLCNNHIPGASYYYLASGNKEPSLSCEVNTDMSKASLLELEQSETFAEFSELQRDRDIPTMQELFPRKVVN